MSLSAEAPPAKSQDDVGPDLPQVRLWTVDDPVECPIPTPGGDSDVWETALEKTRAYDKAQCEVWKDEIDKVLLFASLFSAIVAAFTLESSKKLEVDHQESATTLLLVMHQQLDSMARQSTATLPPLLPDPASTFHVPPYALHVNICWYLSLIVSLTTVITGILCLQWLREHLKDSLGTTKTILFVRISRIQALARWWVPVLIASLPVLLLVSLFLFLTGLAISLWNLNRTVAIAASSATGAIVFFLLATCALPAIYDQCAFRSPQAWAAYQLWRALRYIGVVIVCLVTMALLHFLQLATSLFLIGSKVVDRQGTWQVSWLKSFEGFRLAVGRSFLDPMTSLLSFPPKDWIAIDDRMVKENLQLSNPRYLHWEWFTTALSPDSEAMLAFLQCVNMNSVTEANLGENSLLTQQMVSLLSNRDDSWRALPSDDDAHVKTQNGFNLVMALSIRYAVKKQPALLLQFFPYLLDCHVRLMNSENTHQLDNPVVHRLIDDLLNDIRCPGWPAILKRPSNPDICRMVAELPEVYRQQNREALLRYLTVGKASVEGIYRRVTTMVHLEIDFDPQDAWSTPQAVNVLNRQLEHALTAPTTPDSVVMVGNLADYVYLSMEFRFSGGVWDVGIVSLVENLGPKLWAYINGSGRSFTQLANVIHLEMSKPQNQIARSRVGHAGNQWDWSEFAQLYFGLAPISQDDTTANTSTAAHVTLSVLPAPQPHDDTSTCARAK